MGLTLREGVCPSSPVRGQLDHQVGGTEWIDQCPGRVLSSPVHLSSGRIMYCTCTAHHHALGGEVGVVLRRVSSSPAFKTATQNIGWETMKWAEYIHLFDCSSFHHSLVH